MAHTQRWIKNVFRSTTMGPWIRGVFFGVVFLFASPSMVVANASLPPSAIVERLQKFLDRLETLDADFVQRVVDPEAGVPAESRGHFSTAKPNRFRWDYHTPTEQLIVSDGRTIWFYEQDLAQVVVGDTQRLNKTPAVLLSSGAKLHTVFTWEVFKDAALKLPSIRLFPREQGTIREIVLTLHPDRDELLQLVTNDSLGHLSYFSFQNMRINQPIAQDRFQFEIPPGVDIIQDRAKPLKPF